MDQWLETNSQSATVSFPHCSTGVFFVRCWVETWRVDMKTAQGPNHGVLVSFFVGRAQLAKGLHHYETTARLRAYVR